MTEKEFALEEYRALREEILNKMERNFKILSLGVGGITVILGFVFQYKINELFFVLPILILANSYRYKAENAAILNAGEYICKIENSIYRKNSSLCKCDTDKIYGDLGWENYLRDEKKRVVYSSHGHTADLILGSLYILCVVELWKLNPHTLDSSGALTIIFTGFFIIVGTHYWVYLNLLSKKESS